MSVFAFLDLAIAAVLVAAASYVLRRNRMGLAGLLLAVLASLLVAAEFFGLGATAWVMRVSLAAVAIGLAAAFRHELRHAFERFAAWITRRRRPRRGEAPVDAIARAVLEMAEGRVGALLVFPGREAYEHHLSGGTELQATISAPLLHSLFDPGSPGHDGAVVVGGRRLERFGVHLPLSENHEAIGRGGTRHAAALGLAERCDAACVAVSEERGTITLARDGELHAIGAEQLVDFLERRLGGASKQRRRRADRAWGGAWVDAAVGAALASLLWVFVAPGVSQDERTIEAPIEVVNLPEAVEVAETDPERVEVTLGGPRADLWRLRPDDVRVVIDARAAVHGARSFRVGRDDVVRPDTVEVVRVHDGRVELELRQRAEEITRGP